MATVSDDFNRADSTNLGSNWAEDSGNWLIASNRLQQGTSGGNYRKCRWVGAALDSNDYAVQASVFVSNNGAVGSGVFGRGATSSTVTYYSLTGFPGDTWYLLEITGGSEGILASGGTCANNTTYTIRLECEGSSLRGYINDSLTVSATDATLTSGAVGVMSYGDQDTSSSAYTDNWTAYDLGGGATIIVPQYMRRRAQLIDVWR